MKRIALLLALASGACVHPIQDAKHGQLSNDDVARTAIVLGVVAAGVAIFALASTADHNTDVRPLSMTSPQPFEQH